MADGAVRQPGTGVRPLWATTAALHISAVGLAAVHPHLWPVSLGSVLANHAVLTAAGLCPRSSLLGSNWTRLPQASAARAEIALSIDDGPDPEVTPRVLDLLAAHGAVATFFCIGERVAQHAALAREIVRRGHSIENHTQHHRHHFSLLGPRRIAAEVGRAQETIAAVTGTEPRFFRAPAGLRNAMLDPVLRRLRLQLASWTRRGFDTVNGNPAAVLRKLTRKLCAGDILLLHDGHSARTAQGAPVIEIVLPQLLRAFDAAGLKTVNLRATLN